MALEKPILDVGAITVEIFAILIEIMVGIVIFIALCTQRYEKDERLTTMSLSEDIKNKEMSDLKFSNKLLRHARYSCAFQWLSYFICHILILSHEFATEPVFIDHAIYIVFMLNLTFLFITFRNIGIYYFLPFTNNKLYPNPTKFEELEEQKAEFEEKGDGDGDDETKEIQNNSPHHMQRNDSDSIQNNQDFDEYNKKRQEIRENMGHLFRCIAFTTIIYWTGYIVAIIYNHNNVLLATLAVADILLSVLAGCHMYLIKEIKRNLLKYNGILSGYDDDCDRLRALRLIQLERWFRGDIAILILLIVKFLIMVVNISKSPTTFSWPEKHPIFLATTFVMICALQMSCCRYIWLTKND